MSITKDREQLRIENKNYLVIKKTSTHKNIHLTLLLPGTAPEKVLITHKYRGCLKPFSINKSGEPNEELKVEQIFPQVY